MIVTLCVALWKILIHDRTSNTHFVYKRGDHIARAIWQTMPDAKRTVVIAERAECPYCAASMPFYASLVRAANQAGVEVVSVTPDSRATNQSFLESHHVYVDRIIRLSNTPLRVFATPTLIVLDKNKVVLGAWVGELPPKDEHKVLQLIRSGPQ